MRVMQEWTEELTVMQQTVLITAIRGCDGLAKYHPSKRLVRFVRRSVLMSAMDQKAFTDPIEQGGGSFTGPSITPDEWETFPKTRLKIRTYQRGNWGGIVSVLEAPVWWEGMQIILKRFTDSRDDMPLHYYVHIMHAIEILGYKHPDVFIRTFWFKAYERLVHGFHLWTESEGQMDLRLGDNEETWRARDIDN